MGMKNRQCIFKVLVFMLYCLSTKLYVGDPRTFIFLISSVFFSGTQFHFRPTIINVAEEARRGKKLRNAICFLIFSPPTFCRPGPIRKLANSGPEGRRAMFAQSKWSVHCAQVQVRIGASML